MRTCGLTLVGVAAALLTFGPTASAEGATPNSNQSAKAASASPSVWDSIASGTKSFFSKTADTLSFKKSPPATTRTVGTPTPVPRAWVRPKPKEEKKSWFDGLFAKKEPPPPKSMSDWIQLKRNDP